MRRNEYKYNKLFSSVKDMQVYMFAHYLIGNQTIVHIKILFTSLTA